MRPTVILLIATLLTGPSVAAGAPLPDEAAVEVATLPGPQIAVTFPPGHVTIHKFPGPGGLPTILVLPPSTWTCEKVLSGTPSPAAVGQTFPSSGDHVRCTAPSSPISTPYCGSINTYGYAATGAGSNGIVTVTGACAGLSTSSSFATPGGADADASPPGLAPFPFRCIPTWTAMDDFDDWWVHCQVN